MSYTVASIDRTTLPGELLDLTKSQMRVRHTRDDAFIAEQIAQAIDDVERQTNSTFFERVIVIEADLAWMPWWSATDCYDATPADRVLVKLPFNNVSTLVVLDVDGVDISLDYEVQQTDPGGVGSCVLVAPIAAPVAGSLFTFTAGCASADDLSPSVRRALLRRAAALYENREAPAGLAEPAAAGEPLLWRPSV